MRIQLSVDGEMQSAVCPIVGAFECRHALYFSCSIKRY